MNIIVWHVMYMMTSSNGNIFRVTGLCAGNSPVPVNSPHKGQWCGALIFSLICVWINGWVNKREAGDLRRHCGHYDVIVMNCLYQAFCTNAYLQIGMYRDQCTWYIHVALQWRHNGRHSVSNHQPHGCFRNRLLRRRSKKTPKLRVAGLCAGNSPGTEEFPAQMASNAENVSIWTSSWNFNPTAPACCVGFIDIVCHGISRCLFHTHFQSLADIVAVIGKYILFCSKRYIL